MKGLAVVLRHEIAERRLLLLVSPLLGLLALAAPLLPGAAGAGRAELRDAAALFLALAASGLTALVLGATVVGSDLAAGRLGFWFSRPVAGASIWAGKLGGAAVCAWAAGLLVLLPAALVAAAAAGLAGSGGSLLHNTLLPGRQLALWAASLPLAILAAHAAGVALRARSAWLALDLAGAAVVSALVLTAIRRLQYWGRLADASLVAPHLAIGAGVVLLVASAAQVLGGRTDPLRGHRRLSLSLAVLGLAGALAFTLLAHRWSDLGPQDLRAWPLAWAAPGQSWMVVSGPAAGPPGTGASFLLQPASGRVLRGRFEFGGFGLPILFSADGRHALWAEYQGAAPRSPVILVRLDLDRAGAEPVPTPIVLAGPPYALAVSADGTRVAVLGRGRVAVHEVADGRLLAAAAVDDGGYILPLFLNDRTLRVLVTRGATDGGVWLHVYDLDLVSRKLLERARLPAIGREWSLNPDASRIAVARDRPYPAVALYDLASGRQLADLRHPGAKVRAYYLADGRLAEQATDPAGTEVTVLDGEGHPPAGGPPRFRVPAGTSIRWLQQATADLLLALEVRPRPEGGTARAWQVLDLTAGVVRPLGTGVEPVYGSYRQPLGRAPLCLAGNRSRHLLRIDLVTGERRLLGPARPHGPF